MAALRCGREGHGCPSDPGLQQERTTSSWRRTALSLTMTTAILMRAAPGHTPAHWLGPLLVLGCCWPLIARRCRSFRNRFELTDQARQAGRAPPSGQVLPDPVHCTDSAHAGRATACRDRRRLGPPRSRRGHHREGASRLRCRAYAPGRLEDPGAGMSWAGTG
ncbi:DUF202 domain-containing protein [Pseudonocardia sp. RS010]|uniref:DUF202 domain-containing protein n=1 Tax=Pseudonocardia sp. RS010 TaxID=3385979 RepID=UPI0039A34A49